MHAFAVVRDTDELARVNHMLSPVLTRHMRDQPGCVFLGIWIDAGMVDDVPPVLDSPQPSAQSLFIRETVGLSGLWTVCWCAPANPGRRHALTRATLVQHLAAASTSDPQAFAPVFSASTTADSARAEMDTLQRLNAVPIISPLYQDHFTGLFLPLRDASIADG